MITVILNCYRRPHLLEEQIRLVRAQMIEPAEVWVWVNDVEENRDFDFDTLDADKVFRASHNMRYHGRFALGLLARTTYVAFFDDDTMPGDLWFNTCLDSMANKEGIQVGVGVLLKGKSYFPHSLTGWPAKGKGQKDTIECDLGGHAWFLKREHLNYMWYETPWDFDNCEDIQLSYFALKHGNVKTYAPAQINDRRCSSNSPDLGKDEVASSMENDKHDVDEWFRERDRLIVRCMEDGWRTVGGEL